MYPQLHCGQASRFDPCELLCIISSPGHNLSMKLKLCLPSWLGSDLLYKGSCPQCFLGSVYAPETVLTRGRSKLERESSPAHPMLLSRKPFHCKGYTRLLCLSSHIQPPFLQKSALVGCNRSKSAPGTTEDKILQYHSLPNPRSNLFPHVVIWFLSPEFRKLFSLILGC